MKTIIYYRKSTDRDEYQANSLEHQLENCRKVVNTHSFEVVKEIGESKSAKIEGTRPGFNEMLKICKTGRIDYIVIDEAKRLSRNNLDSARIIDLFDKNLIKGIYSSGRVYLADQINDIFLLQLDLSLSKMDNAHRSKDVKDKMSSCIKNTGRFLWKAPFGYKNITIKKGHKEIIIDKKEAEVVKKIYKLRLENKAYSTIAGILKETYGNKIKLDYSANRIQKLVIKKFYYGVFTWEGKDIVGSHKPLISKETYDKANNTGRGVHQIPRNIEIESKRAYRKYPLKGLVKDSTGIYLTSYTKKGIIYYGNQFRSTEKVSINETKLFNTIGEYIKQNEGSHKLLTSIDKDIIMDLLKHSEGDNNDVLISIKEQIKVLENKQDELLDLKLENTISKDVYLKKYNKIESEIQDLKQVEENGKKDDFEQKTQILLELAGSFYTSYSSANNDGKTEIIKKLMLELFVNTKKELQTRNSPLFESSKMLNCAFGIPTENGTPISALRRPHPNH